MDSLNGSSTERVVSAVVLLAGGLVLPPLARASRRSVLDLTVAPGESVLEQWMRLLGDVSGAPIRVVHGPQIPAPVIPGPLRERVGVVRERDAYRGPAGAIRDAIAELPADRWALVIEATRYHSGSLGPVFEAIKGNDADVFVTCNADRTPAGVYAMRRSVLDHVASVGYVDLKEQLLARARAAGDRVSVVEHDDVVSFPLRTRSELLRAAAISGGERLGIGERPGAPRVLTGERWRSVVSEDASVDPSAVVVESVVMPGARVERDAVVARSIVCPGACVEASAVALEQIVAARKFTRTEQRTADGERRSSQVTPRVPVVRFGWRADRQQGTAT